MTRIDHRIIMTGIICLTIIYIALLVTKNMNGTIGTLIVGMIGLTIGVVLPAPKIDNRRGVLIWQTKKIWTL